MTVGCILPCNYLTVLLCSIGETKGDRGCQAGNAYINTSLHGTVSHIHVFHIGSVFSLSKQAVVSSESVICDLHWFHFVKSSPAL